MVIGSGDDGSPLVWRLAGGGNGVPPRATGDGEGGGGGVVGGGVVCGVDGGIGDLGACGDGVAAGGGEECV